MTPEPVYLVDASIYLFRAWYSMPDGFENARGEPTNAVYGFTGFLCSLLEQTDSPLVGIAFDVSLTTSFRNEIYPEYKANREPAPVALKRQFAWARDMAEAMGLKCYGDERFEADDIIGTLASCWKSRGHAIHVVTGDKDLAQLVEDGDTWWDFARNRQLGSSAIAEHFGVRPDQIADYLALTGDAVDNIPGVPGIGPKTAAALLAHFGSLDAIWSRLGEIPHLSFRGAKTLAPKLESHREAADLARRLTGIERAVPSALADPDVRRVGLDEDRLNTLFDDLAFGGMLRQRCLACG
ncbi:exodeoxyribonuclease IX [Marinihelvus fidelis]|uniref:Exodeoxyribonuclease IX n=1 Tax=Marinihelvus fidelis TaxID=2613842 RepID=A0A5N0T7C4_9GAMM|nr:5'-3' exonuclease H3TH domain-containing protein [Marinihelvus fidelis]KAA9130945.1 exodeoxyribonuclease IX [Marinihelvus fidelis]